MSTPWSRAHERAMAQLRVRTHHRREKLHAPIAGANTGQARRLVLDGTEYSSVTRAARSRHVSPRRIYNWIAAGRGYFL